VGGDGARYAQRLPAVDGSIDIVKVSLISTVKDGSTHAGESGPVGSAAIRGAVGLADRGRNGR
jgi:hypothetical protein